ncbi:uncharacterized protein [Gossypium hirsutum]|uniref:Retrovirus-related Pol polyprotein from transposon TNT 1-94-like beta-barrel domain-containing protein n=1 Tax=Gossypium hirsutum TaxID=3635 RepID=A0A1U8LXK5_GOSHI|nr:uncharacterized protein LOC107930886 [Gossypium hirsutum]
MKDSESIEEYSDKFIDIANKVRVLGTDLSDFRLKQKILVSAPEKYEVTVASLNNTNDLTQLRAVELIKNHPHFWCWRRPDVKCRRWNLMRHLERFCKELRNQQQGRAHAAIKEEEGRLFFSLASHLALYVIVIEVESKDRNGEYLEVKGRGTLTIESCIGTKLISNVMFVFEIDQNLLSAGQLVEKRFKVMFEEGRCLILDSSGNELFRIKMQKKSLSLNPFEEEQVASKC